jgi:WD40 repeat protein
MFHHERRCSISIGSSAHRRRKVRRSWRVIYAQAPRYTAGRFRRSPKRCRDCAVTPDGRFVISVHSNGRVTVWDRLTMAAVATLDAPPRKPTDVQQAEAYERELGASPRRWRRFAASPDSRRLAVAGWEAVDIWDLERFNRITTLEIEPSAVDHYRRRSTETERSVVAVTRVPAYSLQTKRTSSDECEAWSGRGRLHALRTGGIPADVFDQLECCPRSTRSARSQASAIRSVFPSLFQEKAMFRRTVATSGKVGPWTRSKIARARSKQGMASA